MRPSLFRISRTLNVTNSFILDCLDSLLLLGMKEEYQRARQWVATELSFDTENRHHAFEVCLLLLYDIHAESASNRSPLERSADY